MRTMYKKESIKVEPFYGDESGKKGYSSFKFFPKVEVSAKKHGYLYLMEGCNSGPYSNKSVERRSTEDHQVGG